MSDSIFGPQYTVPLPPLAIKVRPDSEVDPVVWRGFRFAVARAVTDLMEIYDLHAKADCMVADEMAAPDA